jgi:hypothetical protein
MGKRLLTIGLCALGVAGLSAGTASARSPWGPPPAQIQLFDAHGLVRTITCPTPTALPECGGDEAAGLALAADVKMPMGTPSDVIGAYRLIDPRGKWYMSGANNDASEAILNANPMPVEDDMAYIASLDPAGASAARANAHARGHAAKKGHGHHTKGHAARKR